MNELFLIRHGETNWNKEGKIQGISDIELNENGIRQAVKTAEILANYNWDFIYSSPLKRASKTARIISEATGVSGIRKAKELIEFNFGKTEGMDILSRKEKYPDRALIPEAESIEDFRFRIRKCLSSISNRHESKRIIIVSHACLIMEALDIFSYGVINGRKIRLKNLSISLLTHDFEWNIPWYNRSAKRLAS